MNPQTKQLAKQIFDNLNYAGAELGNYSVLIIEEALTAFEQSIEQPEAISGEKTIEETLSQFVGWSVSEITSHPGFCLMYGNEALAAMQLYASQQTAFKDQKITELTNLLSDTNKRIQEIQDEEEKKDREISELKAEVEKVDYAYRNIEKRYNNAVTQVDELKAEVAKWQKNDDSLRVAYKELERKFHVISLQLKEVNDLLNNPEELGEYIAGM